MARRTRVVVVAVLFGTVATAGCSRRPAPEGEKVTETAGTVRRVGELERLGKNQQDFLVLGIDAPGFAELPARRKTLLYDLYRAAIAGHTIADQQNHRYALEIRNLLEEIYRNSEGLDPAARGAVLDYLKYIWINHGPYDHDGHTKTLPYDRVITDMCLWAGTDRGGPHVACQ